MNVINVLASHVHGSLHLFRHDDDFFRRPFLILIDAIYYYIVTLH